MITIENADKALKTYYLDAVSAQLNEGISPFFTAIEKNANSVYGKDVKTMVSAGFNGSVMAGSEDGDLPAPYSNRYYDITVPLKNIYGTIEISDKAIRAAQNNNGSFINLLNAEMEGLVSAAKFNFQRMLYGNGSGYLCKAEEMINTVRIRVSSTKGICVGTCVDFMSEGAPIAGGEELTILDIDQALKVITISSPISKANFVAGCDVVIHGVEGNELSGLANVFEGDTLYGYEKSVDGYFRPKTYEATSQELTEDYLVGIIDEIEENYGSKPNMILCSFAVRRKIAAILTQNRAVVDTTTLEGGYGAILFNGVPVVADRFCPEGVIYVINTQDFCLHQLCDWEWLEDEDGKILKQIAGKAAYSATLVKYAELVCSKPCAQTAIYITD
ncbi:MAG: phage major capsid protein [Clostridia bacterium]|nr:phage major capsid protein [Clostridia bacterium]